jgi:pseudaminic acid cytidylyltransferase
MKSLAIIPARGGSKRIPRKNIKEFCGKPILAYSIEAARKAGCFREIMVSTDDEEIAGIASRFGAKVPFLRSAETSNDHAGILEVLEEVIRRYQSELGEGFDAICCILPTAPLIRSSDLLEAESLFLEKNFDSVFPVVRFSYPIQRSLQVVDGKVSMIWPENYPKRSQDLPSSFHDVGQFYWLRPESCFSKRRVFTDNSGSIEIGELQVQDIDTDEDWKICELKYRFLNRRKALILTEAGPDIGFGHATRCRSLTRKLEDKNCQVDLWIHSDRGIPLPGGVPSRNWWDGSESLLEVVRKADLVVLDSFLIPKELLARIEESAKFLVSIDDYPRRSYAGGVVVDWTVGARRSWFPESSASSFLLGPDYCALRPAFWDAPKRSDFRLRRILVTFGGTDIRDLTTPCLRKLCVDFPDLEFHAVARPDSAAALAELGCSNLRIHSNLDDKQMANLMRHCQLAVCGGGQTLYELASCGCPAVVVGLIDNQMDDIRGFESQGSIRYAGEWNSPGLWSTVAELVENYRNPELLEEHSSKAASLVDGQGADRLADALLSLSSGWQDEP